MRGGAASTIWTERHTPSSILIYTFACAHAHKHTHTHSHYHSHWRKRSEICFQSREGESPSWVNPCLRVLVPSPSWIGLDSFFVHFLFFLPSQLEWTQQQVLRILAAHPLPRLKKTTDSLLLANKKKYIFLSLPISPVPQSLSNALSFFSFLAFNFFTGNCCCCILWEWGIFFTWVSVEKGEKSIKFELLKTIATSTDCGLNAVEFVFSGGLGAFSHLTHLWKLV